jgi:hypothetical protein
MIPDDVKSYWHAQGWLFVHIGLPLLGVAFLVLIAQAWLEHRDDMNVNDDSPRKTTKILDL